MDATSLMDTAWNEIAGLFYWDYLSATMLIVYILLKYFLLNKTKLYRVRVNIIAGIVLGVAFYFTLDYQWNKLLVSLLSTVAFYQWIVKFFARKFTKIAYEKAK